MMKLIQLFMLYTGCKSVGRIIQTMIYVVLMMIVILFSVMICSVMQ